MTANQIIDFARIAHLRELNAELAKTKARLREIEQERDALMSHFNVALVALHDFCQLADGEPFRIIDGWNVVLRNRNVAKLKSSEVSNLKERGAERPVDAISEKECGSAPVREWIVFDGSDENSYRVGERRVTYTGGIGLHRADRLILDYIHAVRLLGLDTSRICVETADRDLAKKIVAFGATVSMLFRQPNEKVKNGSTPDSVRLP